MAQSKVIVVLGETGVGKTSFIKSICLFERFVEFTKATSSSDSVLKSGLANNNAMTTTMGQNTIGESETKVCKIYNVKFGNESYSIVDTPGIGDTSGLEQDKINLQNIFTTLSSFPAIHSICVLLKQSDSRAHTFFEYCIRQIFGHLPKAALNNLCIVITHGYGFHFDTEQSLTILKGSLAAAKFSQVSNHINDGNSFCVDNQFIKYFSSRTEACNSVVNAELKERAAQVCWDVSRKEVLRLLNHTNSQVPVTIDALIELSIVKAYISGLSQPIVDITTCLVGNILSISKLTKSIKDILEKQTDLKSIVSQTHETTRTIIADKPWYTCQTTRCKEKKSSDGTQIECKQLFPMDLGPIEYGTFIVLRTISPLLPLAASFLELPPPVTAAFTKLSQINCSDCGCSLTLHNATCTKTITETIELKNEIMESMINNNKSQAEALESELQKRQDELGQLEHELEILIKIRIKMMCYLKQISTQELHELNQGDLYVDRLDGLLEEVNANGEMNDKNKVIELLNKIKSQYLLCLHEVGKKSNTFTLQDIRLIKEELNGLPMYGEIICSILNTLPGV